MMMVVGLCSECMYEWLCECVGVVVCGDVSDGVFDVVSDVV